MFEVPCRNSHISTIPKVIVSVGQERPTHPVVAIEVCDAPSRVTLRKIAQPGSLVLSEGHDTVEGVAIRGGEQSRDVRGLPRSDSLEHLETRRNVGRRMGMV